MGLRVVSVTSVGCLAGCSLFLAAGDDELPDDNIDAASQPTPYQAWDRDVLIDDGALSFELQDSCAIGSTSGTETVCPLEVTDGETQLLERLAIEPGVIVSVDLPRLVVIAREISIDGSLEMLPQSAQCPPPGDSEAGSGGGAGGGLEPGGLGGGSTGSGVTNSGGQDLMLPTALVVGCAGMPGGGPLGGEPNLGGVGGSGGGGLHLIATESLRIEGTVTANGGPGGAGSGSGRGGGGGGAGGVIILDAPTIEVINATLAAVGGGGGGGSPNNGGAAAAGVGCDGGVGNGDGGNGGEACISAMPGESGSSDGSGGGGGGGGGSRGFILEHGDRVTPSGATSINPPIVGAPPHE